MAHIIEKINYMSQNHSDNPVIHRSDRESDIDPKLSELHSLAT